ncbi:MAG: hypothetical protein ACXAC8_13125 [Candidatus Hodarchaeales archaeon]|jgi:hypothetical protein
MRIEQFATQYLDCKDPHVLEVYQGYLIAGKIKGKPRCFWINKQNIEGLAEIAKIVAIESAFHALLSLIPGGSFAYRLIKDQIGYPPRYNVIFEPQFYDITYSVITLDQDGQSHGLIDGLFHNIDSVAKIALKTGSKVQDAIFDFITGKKSKDSNQISSDELLGFTYIRFDDKTSIVRNKLVKERLAKTSKKAKKIAKAAVADIIPPVVISLKTTANEEAIRFLKYLQKIGFRINFSEVLPY